MELKLDLKIYDHGKKNALSWSETSSSLWNLGTNFQIVTNSLTVKWMLIIDRFMLGLSSIVLTPLHAQRGPTLSRIPFWHLFLPL